MPILSETLSHVLREPGVPGHLGAAGKSQDVRAAGGWLDFGIITRHSQENHTHSTV